MGHTDTINATGGSANGTNCGWEICKGHQPALEDPYPDSKNSKMTRGSLRNWPPPTSNPYQSITPIHVKPGSYKFQRHHVIPVNVFKLSKIISKNLALLGYNINIYNSNGISLPFEIDALVWDNLQYHRGSHPNYNKKVRTRLNGIRSQCVSFCAKDDQKKLLELIDEEVKAIIKDIQQWTLFIHDGAGTEKNKRRGIMWK